MAESKKIQRMKTVSDGRIAEPFKPEQRPVREIEFACTSNSDGTTAMEIFLGGLVKYAGEDGYPTVLHFYLTKNENINLTERNKVLDLRIPIISVAWNINSRESMNSFIRDAKNISLNKQKYLNMPKEERNQKENQYTEKLYNFIKTELAIRYIHAKNHNDKIIMNQIKNLRVMKDSNFDYDLFEAITKAPKCLRHKNKSHYLIYEKDGNEDYVQINDNQAKIYNSYRENLDRYISSRKQLIELNNVINSYKTYDIEEYNQKQTIGAHSLYNTIRGGQVISAPKQKPKQSQPGDE